MAKPILCLDFDGVLHSYTSGWKGARVIPDPPVPGALEFLVGALDHFEVCILSSRSHQWGGRRAMKRWLRERLVAIGCSRNEAIPAWLEARIFRTVGMEPWDEEVRYAVDLIIKEVRWPLFKPPATVTLDDRALTFTGTWPSIDALLAFRPWNKRR